MKNLIFSSALLHCLIQGTHSVLNCTDDACRNAHDVDTVFLHRALGSEYHGINTCSIGWNPGRWYRFKNVTGENFMQYCPRAKSKCLSANVTLTVHEVSHVQCNVTVYHVNVHDRICNLLNNQPIRELLKKDCGNYFVYSWDFSCTKQNNTLQFCLETLENNASSALTTSTQQGTRTKVYYTTLLQTSKVTPFQSTSSVTSVTRNTKVMIKDAETPESRTWIPIVVSLVTLCLVLLMALISCHWKKRILRLGRSKKIRESNQSDLFGENNNEGQWDTRNNAEIFGDIKISSPPKSTQYQPRVTTRPFTKEASKTMIELPRETTQCNQQQVTTDDMQASISFPEKWLAECIQNESDNEFGKAEDTGDQAPDAFKNKSIPEQTSFESSPHQSENVISSPRRECKNPTEPQNRDNISLNKGTIVQRSSLNSPSNQTAAVWIKEHPLPSQYPNADLEYQDNAKQCTKEVIPNLAAFSASSEGFNSTTPDQNTDNMDQHEDDCITEQTVLKMQHQMVDTNSCTSFGTENASFVSDIPLKRLKPAWE